jgi:hypothetical protein
MGIPKGWFKRIADRILNNTKDEAKKALDKSDLHKFATEMANLMEDEYIPEMTRNKGLNRRAFDKIFTVTKIKGNFPEFTLEITTDNLQFRIRDRGTGSYRIDGQGNQVGSPIKYNPAIKYPIEVQPIQMVPSRKDGTMMPAVAGWVNGVTSARGTPPNKILETIRDAFLEQQQDSEYDLEVEIIREGETSGLRFVFDFEANIKELDALMKRLNALGDTIADNYNSLVGKYN